MKPWSFSGIALLLSVAVSSGALAQAPEQGSGPYPALYEERADLPDHVVYRPADLAPFGRAKLGIYVWGNGGCSADATSSRNHLLEIASHGYLVIASGTVPKDPKSAPAAAPAGRPTQLVTATKTSLMTDAIDWAQRENDRAGSLFRQRIAIDEVAASGWSCGGLQALSVAQDKRVKTAIIMNSGFFSAGTNPISGVVSDKALLATLHTPILYILGGPKDIAYANGTDDYRRITALPAALVNIPVGHGGTYMQQHGGLGAQVATAWLDWQLKGDAKAAAQFTGADCGLCKSTDLTIERKNIR